MRVVTMRVKINTKHKILIVRAKGTKFFTFSNILLPNKIEVTFFSPQIHIKCTTVCNTYAHPSFLPTLNTLEIYSITSLPTHTCL